MDKTIKEIEDSFEKLVGRRLSIDTMKDFLMSYVSPRESFILQMRFGMMDGKTHTLEEVGKNFGVTRERIRQIVEKCIEKLKKFDGGIDKQKVKE